MASRSQGPRIHRVFNSFADSTTMHGIPHIINARSYPARIFWSAICLVAFLTFSWQCYELLKRYYSYPKKVNVEIIRQAVTFPAVSVCNVEYMNFELAENLIKALKEEYGDMESNATDYDYTGDYDMEYVPPDMDNVPPPKECTYSKLICKYLEFMDKANLFVYAYSNAKGSSALADLSREALSRLSLPANLGVDTTSQASIRLQDFIIKCHFMDEKREINSKIFKDTFDPYYFNCFTFDAEQIVKSGAMSLARGVDYGLSSLLFTGSAGKVRKGDIWDDNTIMYLPGVEESDSALVSGRGARVVVHAPNTQPFPTADGYDIPPGFSVTIGVKARENQRLSHPFGNCTKSNTSDDGDQQFKYTLTSCQNDCIQKVIMAKCECVDNRLSIPADREGLPFCFKLPDVVGYDEIHVNKFAAMMDCRREVYAEMTMDNPLATQNCQCYPPCHDIVYDTTYSLSTLPSDPKENTVFHVTISDFIDKTDPSRKETLIKKLRADHNDTNLSMMRQLSRLNVYIADNNIIKTTEAADYEAIRLVSDLGGLLGLWIGISVITLFEVLQLVANVFHLFTAKGRFATEKNSKALKSAQKHVPNDQPPHQNGDRFYIPDSDHEFPHEVDKLTTV